MRPSSQRFDALLVGTPPWADAGWHADIILAAQTDANVLLISDDACRNECAARLIHARDRFRRRGQFQRLDCREHSEGLASLYAITAPTTLFFDHVDALDRSGQLDLYRLVSMIGRNADEADGGAVRIICATTRDLLCQVGRSRFRADLYYRLNVVTIRVPPPSVARMPSAV